MTEAATPAPGLAARVRAELGLLLLALQFLTRVPLPAPLAAWTAFDAARQRACARYFPFVGLLVGAWGAAVTALAHGLWPLPVALVLGLAATLLFTGALHEDGWADTCDGLGGGATREQALTIMKDSRLGSYGVLGLVVALNLKLAALWGLAATGLPALFAVSVWAHGVSRFAAVATMLRLPYAGDLGRAKVPDMGGGGAAVAIVLPGGLSLIGAAALLQAWCGLAPLLAGAAATAATTLVVQAWLRRRLGGQTGDTLGAVQQLGEIAALLGALALQRTAS